jgi:hypothetical protein
MEHSVLYWDETRYSSFPILVKGENDELWIAFSWNSHTPLARGIEGAVYSHAGGLAGGATGHVELFSPDGGNNWFEEGKDAQYRRYPETLRSAVLSDGTQIRISRPVNTYPPERKEEFVQRSFAVEEFPECIHVEHSLQMQRKRPGEEGWESRTLRSGEELPFFALIRNGADLKSCVLADDTLVHQVYGSAAAGDPYRAWVLRSEDAGETWDMVTMAYDGGEHPFNESYLLNLPNGRIVAMVRTSSGSKKIPAEEKYLWQTHSDDGGKTWSAVKKTGMWGYPPHLLLLSNGNVLCSYGHRRSPYGVRACVSRDGGETWDTDNEVVLRDDGLTIDGTVAGQGTAADLGYPKTVELADGSLFTVYYFTLGDSVTHVAATKWTLG